MVIRKIPVRIEEEEVLRLLDCRKESDLYEEYQEEFRELKDQMESLCETLLIIEPGEIPAAFASEDLPVGTKVLMVLYSIGGGISRYSTEAFRTGDYVKGMLANSMADAALFSIGRGLEPYLKEASAEQKMGVSRRLESPHDIPMEAQKLIFEKTGAAEYGIGISSGYMLDPVKSSGVMYVLSEDRELFFHQHNCRKCSRLDCKGRHIPDIPVRVSDGAETYQILIRGQESILDALVRERREAFTAVCGGTGRCGKCRILLRKGYLPVTAADSQCLQSHEIEQGMRLACRAYPQEPLEIVLSMREEMRVLTSYGIPKVEEDGNEAATGSTITESVEVVMGSENAEPNSHPGYGIAVDIGTTTIAMKLVTADGRQMDLEAFMNHQRSFGADVISRIKASCEGQGEVLTQTIRTDLTEGMKRLMKRNRLDLKELKLVTISCNTTMGHLLMGYDCKTLGEYPFTPVSVKTAGGRLKTLLTGLDTEAEYYLLPGISAFVGADIVAGLCLTQTDLSEEVSLLIDLGTNGEIALGNRDRILVTSTAAGPAFEGGNLTWGIGSVPGAVCGVTILNGRAVVRTIDEKPPVGICGTGAIEALAALYEAGIVDETGLLDEAYFEDGYPLAETVDGKKIVLTQKDIREIQLAKAAVRSGIEILLLRYGISAKEIDRVYLAGGFGYGLDLQKAVTIGMLPQELLTKAEAVGNSSLGGALKCLAEADFRERAERVGQIAQERNLSEDECFNDYYMRYMFLEEEE